MAIPAHRFQSYVDTIVRRTGIPVEAAEAALNRVGKMPHVPDDLFSAVSNYDVMGMSGMPEQSDLKNLYLDHFDISGSGQPRSQLKTGDIRQIAPEAKPLLKPQQAPPQAAPRPSLTSTAPTPTKVSTTPAAGRVSRATQLAIPGMQRPVAPMQGPIEAPRAYAGSNPGVIQYLQDMFTGGKQVAGNAANATGKGMKAANAAILPGLAKNGVRLAAGGGILSALAAAGEFADTEDSVARNATQAVGNVAGGWRGTLGGAALGTAIMPGIGTVLGGIGGGILGSVTGSNVGGGLYDAVMGESPEDRARQQRIKDANMNNKLALAQAATQRQIMVDDLQARMPMMKDAMAIKRQDDMLRAERELRVNNDYNYANALNQAMINAQQQAATQELALTQYMMG